MADWISTIKREKKIVSAVLILFGLGMIIGGVSSVLYYLSLLSSPEVLGQMNVLEPFGVILSILITAANLIAGILLVVLGKKILK